MSRPGLVAFCGNLRRPSRSRSLVEALGSATARQTRLDLKGYDVLDLGPSFGSALTRADLPLPAARILEAIEQADALIVGTPVYKGAYTGLFKHLVDFIEPERLQTKPVALTATGGGPRHALVVEHSLRPLFGFFGALTLPTAVYASDGDFTASEDGYVLTDAGIAKRLASAARELSSLLAAPAESQAAPAGRLTANALWSPDR